MQHTAVIRLCDGQWFWYPPGAGEDARALDTEQARAELAAFASGANNPLWFALPGELVRLARLPCAASERRHAMKSLAFLMEEQLGEDIDDLHFAAVPDGEEHLAVATCRTEHLSSWQEALRRLADARCWLPEPLLLPWQAGEWCLLVEGDRALVRTGKASGFGCDTEMLPVMLSAALADPAIDEPARIVVYGQDQQQDISLLPEAMQALAQWRRGNYASALMLVDEKQPALDLRQGDYARRLPLQRWWTYWRTAAALLAVAFIIQVAATWTQTRELEQQNLSLRQQVEASYRQAVPRGNAPDPERQIRNKLSELKGGRQGSGFVSLLDKVGGVVAKREGASIASINYNARSGDLRMNLLAPDYETVEAVRQAIAKQGLEAVMESSNSQGDGVRARMRVKS